MPTYIFRAEDGEEIAVSFLALFVSVMHVDTSVWPIGIDNLTGVMLVRANTKGPLGPESTRVD